ncbi:MAG: hypothetical protein RBS56_04390 [Candidatus Gracilibacteria bacterium]|nr:hypothetical protein [Candidatus Gracilibacteria bacterium]
MKQVYAYTIFTVSALLIIYAAIGSLILIFNILFGVQAFSSEANYYACKYQSNGEMIDPEFGNVDEITMSKLEIEERLKQCKAEEEASRKADAINDLKRKGVIYLSILLVAVPVYVFHYRMIRRA